MVVVSSLMCTFNLFFYFAVVEGSLENENAVATAIGPPCKIYPYGLYKDPVTCHKEGTRGIDKGEQCIKILATDKNGEEKPAFQFCDHFYSEEFNEFYQDSSICELYGNPTKCCLAPAHTGLQHKTICSGGDGFVTQAEKSDFDDCSSPCTTTTTTTTIAAATTTTVTTTFAATGPCCKAYTPECRGCVEGKTASEWCALNPEEPGCENSLMQREGTDTCKSWCAGLKSRGWLDKCKWKSCDGCDKCKDHCQSWCPDQKEQTWQQKCSWKSCRLCKECSAMATKPNCQSWCAGHRQGWNNKCKWKSCNACDVCVQSRSSSVSKVSKESEPECKKWCPGNSHSWNTKCKWKSCRRCTDCGNNRRLERTDMLLV